MTEKLPCFHNIVQPSLKICRPYLSPSPDDSKNISRKIQITKSPPHQFSHRPVASYFLDKNITLQIPFSCTLSSFNVTDQISRRYETKGKIMIPHILFKWPRFSLYNIQNSSIVSSFLSSNIFLPTLFTHTSLLYWPFKYEAQTALFKSPVRTAL